MELRRKLFSEPQGRSELKFIIDAVRGRELLQSMNEFVELDSHTDEYGGYQIASLYYDTPKLRFYWDRTESVGYRRKVRLRTYLLDGKPTASFIEIKERHKSAVVKKRSLLRGALPSNLELPNVLPLIEKEEVQREVGYLSDRLNLRPTATILYHRLSRVGKFDRSLRVTLDTALRASSCQFSDGWGDQHCTFPPDLAILEVKFTRNMPLWVQTALRSAGLNQVRYSKYCEAVERLGNFELGGQLFSPQSSEVDSAERRSAVGYR